jgi:hypothetical protein
VILPFSWWLLAFAVFLLRDDLLELFIGFWSSSCASWDFGMGRVGHLTLLLAG